MPSDRTPSDEGRAARAAAEALGINPQMPVERLSNAEWAARSKAAAEALGIVSLNNEATRVTGSVVDQIALGDAQVRQQVIQGNLNMRQRMARGVGWTFGIANGVTLLGVAVLAGLDQWNMVHRAFTTADRIVDQKVVMTLIGATTVQVGAISFVIARYLFPAADK